MINIEKIATLFSLPAHRVYKLLLDKGNSVTEKIMHKVDNDIFIQRFVYDKMGERKDYLDGKIFQPKSIVGMDLIPFDKEPRVYFLIDGHVVVYVGQTRAMADRIGTHTDTKEFDKVISFVVEGSELNMVEGVNIMAYNPHYNSVIWSKETYFNSVLSLTF